MEESNKESQKHTEIVITIIVTVELVRAKENIYPYRIPLVIDKNYLLQQFKVT